MGASIGASFGPDNEVLADITAALSKEVDSSSLFTQIPSYIGLRIGVSYGHWFNDFIGIYTGGGIAGMGESFSDNKFFSAYISCMPSVRLFKHAESAMGYLLSFPIRADFTGSSVQVSAGIGFTMHISERYLDEYDATWWY